MNRTTSLFLALGVLVAHALAIHHTESGRLAPAFDETFVAFRVARNLFRVGPAAFSGVDSSFDAYPSILWVLVSWIPERLYWDPSTFCQVVGMGCALATSVVVSRFSRERLAGIIAPLLVVVSGSFASAAISGTETTLLTLCVTAGFLAYERRRRRSLAIFLALAAAARPEGLLFTLALLGMELFRAALRRQGTDRRLWPWFLPALGVGLAVGLTRLSLSRSFLSPTIADALTFDAARLELGLAYLSDFFLKSGGAVLVLFPLVALLRGKLVGTAVRALYLVAFWSLYVAWTGGSALPMWMAMVPIVPILFLTVQEGMTAAMDSRRTGLAAATWVLFVLAVLASSFVSKKPGNIGRFHVADLHFAAMTPSPAVRRAYGLPLGREGLAQYIARTERLRSIGRFLREEFNGELGIATTWPGSIGYISRRKVVDLLGRTAPRPGAQRALPWFGERRTDLVEYFDNAPGHVVLSVTALGETPRIRDVLGEWLARFDDGGAPMERLPALLEVLEDYELVTIPVEDRAGSSTFDENAAFILLRRRGLGMETELTLEVTDERDFRVLVDHGGYEQLANLEVRAVDRDGTEWSMRPTGEFVQNPGVSARSMLLLFENGARSVELVRGTLPETLDASELIVRLRNPGLPERFAFANVGEELRRSLDG